MREKEEWRILYPPSPIQAGVSFSLSNNCLLEDRSPSKTIPTEGREERQPATTTRSRGGREDGRVLFSLEVQEAATTQIFAKRRAKKKRASECCCYCCDRRDGREASLRGLRSKIYSRTSLYMISLSAFASPSTLFCFGTQEKQRKEWRRASFTLVNSI